MPVSANNIITTQGIRAVNAITTAAKVTHGDATNAVKLCDAGANGSILFGLNCMPRLAAAATVTATQLQLFRSPDNGAALFLIGSALMLAHTMAVTTAVPKTPFEYSETLGLRLPIGNSLWVGAAVALASGIVWDGQVEDL